MNTIQSTEVSTPSINEENLPAVVDVSKEDERVFALQDRWDDEAFLEVLKGRDTGVLVYRFKQEGKEICNLSKAGVDRCATIMAAQGHCIEEEEVKFMQDPSDPEYFLFTVLARRVLIDEHGNRKSFETVNGVKRQWTKMKKKDGTTIPDSFWFEKGAMKAGRNARIRLLLPEVKDAIIAAALSDGKVRNVTEKDIESNPQPKPKADVVQYASREKVSEWILENIGPEDHHPKLFKLWAASFGKISKNQYGHLTLDKVDAMFAQRLYMASDNARENFNSWFQNNKAAEDVLKVFPEAETEGDGHEK